MYVCMYVYMYVCIYKYVRANMHMCLCAYVCVYVCMFYCYSQNQIHQFPVDFPILHDKGEELISKFAKLFFTCNLTDSSKLSSIQCDKDLARIVTRIVIVR